jgi:hypothetical protein
MISGRGVIGIVSLWSAISGGGCASVPRPVALPLEIDVAHLRGPREVQRAVAASLALELARQQEAVGKHRSEIIRLAHQSPQWLALELPVGDELLTAPEPGRELSLRYLQQAFSELGLVLTRPQAERLLARWKVHPSDRKIRRELVAARGRGLILYRGDLQAALRQYSALLEQDARQLEEAIERLRNEKYAEQAIQSFYIAQFNAVLGLVRATLDLPLAPYNLYRAVRGQEPLAGLSRWRLLQPLKYVGEYGQKYGSSMETGAFIGLVGAPSIMGGLLGRTVASGTRWLQRNAGQDALALARALGAWLRLGGKSYVIKAQIDIGRALWALATGEIDVPGQGVRPLTEDDVVQLVQDILANLTVAKNVKEVLGKAEEARVEKAPQEEAVERGERSAPPPGMPPELVRIRERFQDPRAVAQLDHMFEKFRGDTAGTLRALKDMQGALRQGKTLEQRLIERWEKDHPPPAPAEMIAKINVEFVRARELRGAIDRYAASHPEVRGVNEWIDMVEGQLKVLDELRSGKKKQKPDSLAGVSRALTGLEAAVREAEKTPGVVAVEQKFWIDAKNYIKVDLVTDGGRTWIEVKAEAPFGMRSGKRADIKDQAGRYVAAAKLHKVEGKPPRVVFRFPRGVNPEFAQELRGLSNEKEGFAVEVEGPEISRP